MLTLDSKIGKITKKLPNSRVTYLNELSLLDTHRITDIKSNAKLQSRIVMIIKVVVVHVFLIRVELLGRSLHGIHRPCQPLHAEPDQLAGPCQWQR